MKLTAVCLDHPNSAFSHGSHWPCVRRSFISVSHFPILRSPQPCAWRPRGSAAHALSHTRDHRRRAGGRERRHRQSNPQFDKFHKATRIAFKKSCAGMPQDQRSRFGSYLRQGEKAAKWRFSQSWRLRSIVIFCINRNFNSLQPPLGVSRLPKLNKYPASRLATLGPSPSGVLPCARFDGLAHAKFQTFSQLASHYRENEVLRANPCVFAYILAP